MFASSHVPYDLDRKADPSSAPSIEEMTEKAIRFLQTKSDKGFFLFVEGGRIDHAHHKNSALLAMAEVAAMDRAVKKAKELTNSQDTMILVTADHSHTFNINGYPVRGNKITGKIRKILADFSNIKRSILSNQAFLERRIMATITQRCLIRAGLDFGATSTITRTTPRCLGSTLPRSTSTIKVTANWHRPLERTRSTVAKMSPFTQRVLEKSV